MESYSLLLALVLAPSVLAFVIAVQWFWINKSMGRIPSSCPSLEPGSGRFEFDLSQAREDLEPRSPPLLGGCCNQYMSFYYISDRYHLLALTELSTVQSMPSGAVPWDFKSGNV